MLKRNSRETNISIVPTGMWHVEGCLSINKKVDPGIILKVQDEGEMVDYSWDVLLEIAWPLPVKAFPALL
jgi:hypothetical protein